MNKSIISAIEAVRNNPTDSTLVEGLKALAVPEFKAVSYEIQRAVKTVNRFVSGKNERPNRGKVALAIGLAPIVAEFSEIATIIGMTEMESHIVLLKNATDALSAMNVSGAFTKMDFLPDFKTADEIHAEAIADAKKLLGIISKSVNEAAESINRHFRNGDCDPNTFKVAKAIGFKTALSKLTAELTNLGLAVESAHSFALETVLETIESAHSRALADTPSVGYAVIIPTVPSYEG